MSEMKRDVIKFEELSMNEWPALATVYCGGWLVRMAPGYSKRANSVNVIPNVTSWSDVIGKINLCEQIYAGSKLPAIFKITPLSERRLAKILIARGYREVDRSLVMELRKISILNSKKIPTYVDSSTHAGGWIDALSELLRLKPHEKETVAAIYNAVRMPAVFTTVISDDGRLAGAGCVIVQGEYCGLQSIVIREEYRGLGLGLGQAMVSHLLEQAGAMGAEKGFLQVMAKNQAAINLYKKFGFKESYQYYYLSQ